MMGSVGIGANLNHWAQADSTSPRRWWHTTNESARPCSRAALPVLSPRTENVTANQYVSDDGRQSVLFAFLHSQQFRHNAPAICLRGLDENALYR